MAEPLTLYKLMILYLLKKVNYPLSNGQMSEFFVSKSYTDYFTFQMVINELLGTSLIHKETIRNTSRYELTKEGEEVLFYFENKITGEVKQDMDDFLKENNFKLRTENSVLANYYKSTASNDFEIDCVVKEGKNTLIELKLSASTEEMAEKMCDNWEKASKEIYEFAMKKLL